MHVRRPPSPPGSQRVRRRPAWLRVPAAALLLAALASCGGEPTTTPSPTTTASSTSTESPTTSASPTSSSTPQLSVYFLRSGKIAAAHRTVPKTKAVAAAAASELLKGPTDAERSAGFSSALPPGASVRGIRITKGTASVSLDAEVLQLGQVDPEAELAALAQLTFTLTQFPTVSAVEFWSGDARIARVEGSSVDFTKPVARVDFEMLTPAIFIESPCVGDSVGSPLVVTGTANAFEATFKIELTDESGAALAKQTVTASAGSGTRGTFQVSIPLTTSAGSGTLVAYEVSQETGSRINEVRIPLIFTP
jgi:germination protein M